MHVESQQTSTNEEREHRLDRNIWQERSWQQPYFIRIETGRLHWYNAGSAPIARHYGQGEDQSDEDDVTVISEDEDIKPEPKSETPVTPLKYVANGDGLKQK